MQFQKYPFKNCHNFYHIFFGKSIRKGIFGHNNYKESEILKGLIFSGDDNTNDHFPIKCQKKKELFFLVPFFPRWNLCSCQALRFSAVLIWSIWKRCATTEIRLREWWKSWMLFACCLIIHPAGQVWNSSSDESTFFRFVWDVAEYHNSEIE